MTIGRGIWKSRLTRAILAMAPAVLLLYAYSSGPEVRHTAAPGDDPLACSTAGCHTGTPLNGGGGNVAVTFPAGLTYTPGVPQTLTIVITDSKARVYGFQMTARLESNLSNGQAGDFTAGAQQFVLCDDNTNVRTATRPCPANAPVQFIEHSNPFPTNSISVLWTPPATNAGNVHIYVAGNAANGDGNNTGDHIYTASYVLTPQGTLPPPVIGSIVNAAGYSAIEGLASGAWFGVTLNGIPTFLDFGSPGQVNIQAPNDATTRSGIRIQLDNGPVRSNIVTIPKTTIVPALLAPPWFHVGGQQWAVAQFPDQTFVGKPGLIAGMNFRPARPGDIITIYGIGFGPVIPATLAGTIASGTTMPQNRATFRLGGVPATLVDSGPAPRAVGLYQFKVTVPNIAPGDVPLTVDVGGVTLNQSCFLTVGQ